MKALIITYYWPPSGGSGVQRWMYFAKYLQEFGIEPVVITVDEKYASYGSTDQSLNDKIGHVRVYKTKTLEPLRFYSFLKSGNAQKEIPQGNVGGKKKGLIDKFATYVRGNFFIPDARVGWNRYAFSKAAELLKQESFDVVITTGPPHSTHLVGQKLKDRFNVRWIADFRDPWTEIYYNNLFKRTKRNEARDQNMELSVLQKADLVLTIGPSMKKLLEVKIPGNEDKVKFVYNGYDQEIMQGIVAEKKQRFTATHIGVLSEKQAYLSLANGLRKAFENYSDLEVDFILAGTIADEVLNEFKSIARLNVIHLGRISHQEALQLMFDVHLLTNCLALLKEAKILISGKLMEYIATGNPVLLIGDEEGDAARLLKDYPAGLACDPKEVEKIADFIYNSFKNFNTFKTSNQSLEAFSRHQTTQELSNIIKTI